MAQTGFTPILIYASGTTGNTPSASNLTSSASGAELALNYTDGKLFYKDNAGVVQVLATKGGVGSSSNTQVLYNSSGLVVGSSNLTFDGTTLTSSFSGAHNGTVGATTPNTGAFTSLTATGAITYNTTTNNQSYTTTGAGTITISSGTLGSINNMSIGGTTAAAGTFTTLTATSTITGTALIPSGSTAPTNGMFLPTTNTVAWATNSTERMRLDANGNLGIGGTPSASQSYSAGTATQKIAAFVTSGYSLIQAKAYANSLSSGGVLTLAKSRGTSVGTETATQASDVLGSVSFEGVNSSSGIAGSSAIVGVQDGAAGTTYVPGRIVFYTSDGTNAPAERMRLDASGNLGIGVTPSAWSGYGAPVIEMAGGGTLVVDGSANVGANFYYTGGNYVYKNNTAASNYQQNVGAHKWFIAPSGTAGNAITFTQAMTLFASGGLSLGNTTDPGATNLSVTGTIASASTVTGTQLISNVATGTAPLSVTSTTVVPNLNVSQLLGATWASPGTIGSTTPNTGSFTSLTATGAITHNTTTNNQSYTTSGAGTITITSGTAGNINNMNIGATTAGTGAFTTLSASSTVSGTGFSTYLASPPAIGGTTPAAGTFTALSATSNAVGSVTAKTGGLTAVTAVTGSLTLATGGVTLASQVMASGSVWRVVAYGTYAASSSANARTLTMACYWGSTALTSVTTGNVLASTAQTTPWRVEMEISGSSATAAWCTSVLSAQVTSATIPLNYVGTPTSVTSLTTTSTLDFRVGQTGTATSGDTINVHSVTIERIK